MKKVLLILLAVLVLGVGGVYARSSRCPCDRAPGFVLTGPVSEMPVDDWSFIDDVPLCQVQVWGHVGADLREPHLHGDAAGGAVPQLLDGSQK